MSDAETPVPPTDERLVDTDVEGLLDEGDDPVPDDERVVPEDVNEFLPDVDDPDLI